MEKNEHSQPSWENVCMIAFHEKCSIIQEVLETQSRSKFWYEKLNRYNFFLTHESLPLCQNSLLKKTFIVITGVFSGGIISVADSCGYGRSRTRFNAL